MMLLRGNWALLTSIIDLPKITFSQIKSVSVSRNAELALMYNKNKHIRPLPLYCVSLTDLAPLWGHETFAKKSYEVK